MTETETDSSTDKEASSKTDDLFNKYNELVSVDKVNVLKCLQSIFEIYFIEYSFDPVVYIEMNTRNAKVFGVVSINISSTVKV